jgi:hypothetical protein
VLIVQGPVRRQSYPSGAGNREVIQEETAIEARLDGKWITMSSVAHPCRTRSRSPEEHRPASRSVRDGGPFRRMTRGGQLDWMSVQLRRGISRILPQQGRGGRSFGPSEVRRVNSPLPHTKAEHRGGHRCACNHGENGLDRIVECAGLEFIRRQKSEDATGLTLSLSTGSLAALLSFVRFWPSCLYETKLNERQNEAQG